MDKPWKLLRAAAVLLVIRQALTLTHIPPEMNNEATISNPSFAGVETEQIDVNVEGTTILPEENEERIFDILEGQVYEFEERTKLNDLPSKARPPMTAVACQTTYPDNFEEGISDKDILDSLLKATQYDKRLLPPVKASYEVTAMKYVWINDEDDLRKSPGLSTLNAHLINNHVSLCPKHSNWRGDYSCLMVLLMFTRDRAFYFSTVFIPGITLVMASFITFWLEWNAVPARTTLGVTTMLNFFTNSNDFRLTLPVVTNLTAMYVWEGVCMCFIFAAFLEFVCVNYVGRKRPSHNIAYRSGESPFIQRLPALISRTGFIMGSPSGNRKMEAANEIVTCANCGPNRCTQVSNGCPATEVLEKEPPHPIRVAKTIDVVARVIFPAAFAAFLFFFFYHYRGYNYVHE